ncbi:probable protein phosphatase 2C 21, partial [Miscanthus floridulus]|uniref:probable protein phosphatase 2C 21 n=1 Tax=Miscanthus floridulus TaxID=154761 RepID=UPI003457894C
SQCLLSVNGQTMVLTHSHVPRDADESERIQFNDWWKIRNPEHRAGGLVALNNPPFVTLPISRSIGDYVFKQNKSLLPKDQVVTCEPRMKTISITEDTEFLVIASNGIWKWLTHERIALKIRPYLLEGETDLRFICKQVCIAAANSCVMRDDMTIILVQFKKDAKSTENKDHHKNDLEAEDPNPDMQGAPDDMCFVFQHWELLDMTI